ATDVSGQTFLRKVRFGRTLRRNQHRGELGATLTNEEEEALPTVFDVGASVFRANLEREDGHCAASLSALAPWASNLASLSWRTPTIRAIPDAFSSASAMPRNLNSLILGSMDCKSRPANRVASSKAP